MADTTNLRLIKMTNDRRNFIKNISFLSIALSLDPRILFAKAGIKINDETLQIFDNTFTEISPTVRQLNNFCASSSLDPEQLNKEYFGLINILSRSINPDFSSLSIDQKYSELRAANQKTSLTKEQIKELYTAGLVTLTVGLGVMYITKGKLAILLASTGTVLKLPKWIKNTGKFIDGAATIYKGGKIIKDAVTNDVIYSAEVAKNSIYEKFLHSDAQRLKLEIPDLKFDISSEMLLTNRTLPITSSSNPVVDGLINWINNEIKDKDIFASKEDLEVFLDKYVDKIGKIQEVSLQNVFEAEKEKNRQKAIEERDTAALCQSIHGAIGLAISNFAAPKEAEILNTLIGAGFQYAIAGMTPIGWAAVGINITTSLFSKSSSNQVFEKAVLKALQQIQKQLNFIIEQIEVIQKNQIEILVQLNEILNKIENLEDIVTSEFQNLNDKVDLIYNTLVIVGKEAIENDFLSADNSLLDAFNNKDWESFYSSLQKLRGIALNQLDDNVITKYEAGSFKAEILKKQVLFEQKYKMNISLYDSIGLSSAFYNYNPANDRGTTDFKPIHPVEFSIVSDAIIGWLIVSELSSVQKTSIAKSLLHGAERNNDNFKRIADQKGVKEKSSLYQKVSDTVLFSIHEFMKNDEKNKTVNQANLLNNFNLLSITEIELDNFIDKKMKDVDAASNFINNQNDNKLYNLAKDLKLINAIETISKSDPVTQRKANQGFRDSWPKNIDKYFPDYIIGSTIGVKNNRIKFSNALLDYSKGVYVSFEVLYTCRLLISKVKDESYNNRACGHDGNLDCFDIKRIVTSTKADFEVNPSWKKLVIEQCKRDGVDIHEIISSFDSISFNDFLKHLIFQSFWQIKYDLIKNVEKHIFEPEFSNFDGIGLSLMTLSKLNNLITSDSPDQYDLNYFDELYIREDIASALQGVLFTDMLKEGKELFEKILNESSLDTSSDKQRSIFYLKNKTDFTEKLNPERFVDLCLILLKEKTQTTVRKSIDRTNMVSENNAEPFTEKAISKIKWYIETQV